MEILFSRTTCQLPRLLRGAGVAARFHVRAVSSFPTKPQSIVSDTTLSSKNPESSQTPANSTVANLFSLQDRTVIVTGAGRGLGITLALAVLEAGGNVACLDILPQPSEAEWHRIDQTREKSGLDATYYQCDATDEEHVQRVLAEVASGANKRKRPIRGLIHCAGIQQMTDAIDYPINGFKRILDVNVTGSFIMAKHTARLMKEVGVAGSIVFIASMSGHIANRVCSYARLPRHC
jgi:FlaA1/EpsC-like NDP-sugar epimerase